MTQEQMYKRVLSMKFDTQIKSGKSVFKKIDTPHIVIYEWEDGSAYCAQYKCLPSIVSGEQMRTYIENNIAYDQIRSEYYMFLSVPHECLASEGVHIRALTPKDEEALDNLKSHCAPEECALAQIMLYDMHALGAFIGHELVGVSSILELFGAYDVGILVHPQYRKQGISSALVYENTKWSLGENKTAMYRCDSDNIGSYKTGIKVGYTTKVHITVYDLKEDMPYASD